MLAVHLAVVAMLFELKVAILDLDPQGSAMVWRKARGDVAGPVVVAVPDGSLKRAIEGAKSDGFDLILLDCPPSVSAGTAQIIGAADLVVIPVRPEPFDLAAVPATLRLIGTKNHVFVLSDCPQKAPEIAQARELLQGFGRPVFGPVQNWRAMWRAVISGQAMAEYDPGSKAAQEVNAVCESILKEIA